MGVVYLAEQENPRRHVALKVLRPGLLSADAIRRWRRVIETPLLLYGSVAGPPDDGASRAPSSPVAYSTPAC